MNSFMRILIILIVVTLNVSAVNAEPIKVSVAEFMTVGVEKPQEVKVMVKNLLSSRISSTDVLVIEDDGKAAMKISGGYYAVGKTFSIDATVKNSAGEVLGQKYVQGSSADELIPAISRLAEQLRQVLPIVPSKPEAALRAVAGSAADKVSAAHSKTIENVNASDIVRAASDSKAIVMNTRIEGNLVGVAPGRERAGTDREIAVADAKHVYLYVYNGSWRKVAEYELQKSGKIIALDSVDADGDGELEVYATVMDREELVSVALHITDSGFRVIAEKLPYFFRAIQFYGKKKQLFGQYTGRGADDYYGDVSLVVKNGASYSLGKALKLPKQTNIYSVNGFEDAKGNRHIVTIDGSGFLHVSDESGKEEWSGNDRFGGSETYFLRDEQQMQNVSLDRFRWKFIEQKLSVTPAGEIVVPKNSGSLVMGNNRSFDKNQVYGFVWNGATLEEKWHTKEVSGYLADYFYDSERNEIVTVEQTQKEGIFSRGTSVILIKKIDK